MTHQSDVSRLCFRGVTKCPTQARTIPALAAASESKTRIDDEGADLYPSNLARNTMIKEIELGRTSDMSDIRWQAFFLASLFPSCVWWRN